MLVSRMVAVLAAAGATAFAPTAAPDARPSAGTLVWEVRSEGSSVAMARGDGTRFRLIAPAIYRGPAIISSFHPMPSSDGAIVVFSRQFDGSLGATRLCTRRLRPPFARARCLRRDGRDSLHPVWSPTRFEVAFIRRRGSQYSLGVAELRRGVVRALTPLATPARAYPGTETLLTHQAWSPDGSRVVFSSGGEIFTIRRDRSLLRRLTSSAGVWDRAPAWSPDGTKIAWLRGGNVHVMNSDGGAKTRVTSLRATLKGPPVWAPGAGQLTLAFSAGDGLYVTRARYHRPVRVGTFPVIRGYAWSPDAKQLVATTRDQRAALWTVRADGRERRRVTFGFSDETWVVPSWRPSVGVR